MTKAAHDADSTGAPAQKVAANKAAAKTAATKVAAKKVPAKKAPAKRPAAQKVAAKEVPAKKAAAPKTPPAKEVAAKEVAAKKTPAKKAPAQKVGAQKTSAPADPPRSATAAAKRAAPTSTRTGQAAGEPKPAEWTAAELADVRVALLSEIAAMQSEYDHSMAELDQLQQAGTDGSGDDQADAGSKTFDREQELSIAANRFDLLSQMTRAVERLDRGTYGNCEDCGRPIPRARLQAFPMATLDVACKLREERR